MPAIVGTVVAGLALIGFLFVRAGSGTAEFEAPKTEKVIPKYVWDGMNPQMRQQMEAQGYRVSDASPKGQPTAAPGK